MTGRKIIFLEFNELCPDLLQGWMAQGRLPNFRRFYDASAVFTGCADTQAQTELEPWIQWYSLHTGLTYAQHGVFNLSDGPRAGHTDIWHALLAAGRNVGNFAGMNAPGFAAPGSFYVPDPWCTTQPPYPAELAAYQRVVAAKVQENTNAAAPLSARDYLDFALFLARRGLRGSSVISVLRQLLADLGDSKEAWRRPVLLDRLQGDVFLHYWLKTRPDFASFFINSTAHFQHSYFHLLQPEQFDLPAEMMNDSVHRDAVFFGYQQMDRLLGDFFALERHGVMLVLATALSQRANEKAGYHYYRPRNMATLAADLGVAEITLLPVMAHQYSAEFATPAQAAQARAALSRLTLDGRAVFEFGDAPANTLFFGCNLHDQIALDAAVEGLPLARRFYELFYRIPHTKSGVHHPDSVLWFKTGRHQMHEGRMPIINIFPTLLEYYGAPMPQDAGLTRQGSSFLELLQIGHFGARSGAGALLAAE